MTSITILPHQFGKGFENSTGGESTFCSPLHKDQDSGLHRPNNSSNNSSPGSHDCKKSTWWMFLYMSICFSSLFKWESINWIFAILCIVGYNLNAYCGLEDNLKVPPLLQNGALQLDDHNFYTLSATESLAAPGVLSTPAYHRMKGKSWIKSKHAVIPSHFNTVYSSISSKKLFKQYCDLTAPYSEA